MLRDLKGNQMHPLVPEFIVENYRAGRRRGKFQAATLFIDLSGFSRITDALMPHGQPGAEELTRQMVSVFDPLMKAVFEHGGRVVGLAGDGVTAVYPAEGDLRYAACEALASAQLIQARLAVLAVMHTSYGEFPISAKIGLACGEVSWGILESADRKRATFYFRGDAVDESAEAEHHAEAREVVLSESASELLQGVAQCEPRFGFRVLSEVRGDLPDPWKVTQRPGDPEVTRIFAPETLRTEDVRSEFRHAVQLFLSIPALSDDALEDFMAKLFELQERYGGLISHLDFGDKGCSMLLLWGAPVTFENDISRALNFALELRSRVTFPISAGITFYLALAGYMGSELFEDYTCYGWGVNLAARFMVAAPDGAIWLDERIVQRIIRSFSVEYVGEQAFKGFAQKQRVYVLKGRKAEVESFYEGRLAGREAEMHELAERIAPLWRAAYAGVVLVTGEAGIGKSRLIHEFKASSLFAGRNVLWAVCQSDQVLRLSFNPFRYWLARYFEVLAAPDDAARLRAFELRFDALLAGVQDAALLKDLDWARSFLAALVDVRWPDSPYERMDAQGRYDNTLAAVITLLKAESRRQPLILFIEDAHYLDEDSRALLSRLKRVFSADGSSAVAILVTSRPDEGGFLAEQGFADARIDLGGLSAEAMTALSDDILGAPAAPDLIRFVDQRADGNPFFAEQILRYLQAEGLLELNDSGRWMLSRGWQSSALPADIMTMLVARLDQLAREVQDVIQTASVLGREFEVQVLSRMLSDDVTVDTRVSEAERASIWSPLNELRYLFRHALLRDAAYTMQLQAHRRRLHSLAVDALEGLYANELAFHYPELAFHSEQADLVEKARFYLRRAADSARDAYQNTEALDYYTRNLQLVPADALRERFALTQERALLYQRLGNWDVQAAELDALDELAQQLGDPARRARVLMLKADRLLNIGDFQQCIDVAEQALELARSVMDADVTLGTYLIVPGAYLRQGRFAEAMQHAREGLRQAAHMARRSEQGSALNLMGLIALEQGGPATARGYFEQVLAIAQANSDRVLEGRSVNNLGSLAGFMEGDYAAARDYYRQAYAILHERGDRAAEAAALANLGWVAGVQGDFAAAQSYQSGALAITREVGDPYQEAYTLINLSALASVQGDGPTALRFAEQGLELTTKIGERSGQAWALLYKGHAHLLARQLPSGQEAFLDSVRIREELGQPGLATEPLAGLILLALESGDLNRAGEWTESILAHLQAGGTLDGTEEPLRIHLACYRALKIRKDPRSREVLQAAARLLETQVSKFREEETRRMYVQNVPWRLAVQQAWNAEQTGAA